MIALKICTGRGGEHLKLTEEIKLLIHEHCNSLPRNQSHYSLEHTSLKYFQDSSLCLNNLYAKFCRFSEERKGINVSLIGFSTYSKYFNYFVNFTFDPPRADVCNDCFEYQKKGELDSSAAQSQNKLFKTTITSLQKCYLKRKMFYAAFSISGKISLCEKSRLMHNFICV